MCLQRTKYAFFIRAHDASVCTYNVAAIDNMCVYMYILITCSPVNVDS